MDKRDKVVERECLKCPDCGSNIVNGNKEIYCDSCGLVIAENIVDPGPEWRSYDSEQIEKRVRVGLPMTYRINDKGLKIPIDKFLKGKEGRAGINTTKEQSFIFALSQIERMSSALGLPENIQESASLLYRKAMKGGLIKGRSIEAITSAILYIACRQYGVPRTFKEIEQVSWIEKEYILSAVKSLLEKLELKIPPASPCDFVFRFCSLLNLSIETRAKVLEITNKVFNGGVPTGTVGAIIYIVTELSNEPRTKKEIADVVGVSIPTIRNRFKEISKRLQSDVLKTEN
jgi:transcription initiation factor TFIIB